MPINRVRKKIHHLRRQPEDVRLRAASYVTLIGGILLTVLWVTVLLPLQLRLSGGLDQDETLQQEDTQNYTQNDSDTTSRVGGVRDESEPSQQLFYTAPPQMESQGTIIESTNGSDTYTEPSQPQQQTTEENSNTPVAPVSDPETIPVDVTE